MLKRFAHFLPLQHLSISSHKLIVLCTLYFSFILNLKLWRFFYQQVEISGLASILFAISLPMVLCATLYLLFSLLIWPWIAKPFIILLLIISSITNYFMYQFNVFIDSDMIRNTMQTNQREALDLLTPSAVLWVFMFGILPAILLICTRIRYAPSWKEIRLRSAVSACCMVLIGGIAGLAYKEYASFGRNNSKFTRLINPTNYLYATSRYVQQQLASNQTFAILDATPEHVPIKDPHATVLVLIVGETARAKNFSLNGYERETNPLLAKEDIINFRDVSACGTSTAISVPCMFSDLPREQHQPAQAKNRENLMDLLQKSGYTILWRENDDGCKDVCNRIPTENVTKTGSRQYCDGDSCHDEVLLEGLEDYIKNIKKDTVIVLHMIGSHGPTYFKRYPERFKKFTPTCDTAQIQNCSQEAITNTYDNTILYTDYIVASVIKMLKKNPQHEAGVLYVSDHGESLGENNLYLHGLPYSIAPAEQIKVPMVLWMSETMKKYDYINYASLRNAAQIGSYSHDNLFHSIISLMEVQTKLYNPKYDIFLEHRTPEMPANMMHK